MMVLLQEDADLCIGPNIKRPRKRPSPEGSPESRSIGDAVSFMNITMAPESHSSV